jgi:hypothetical protein
MSDMWQRFVRTFEGAAELAGLAILVALGGVIASVSLFIYWFTTGRYGPAIGLMLALGAAIGVCIRDYRRGKWSILSGILLTIWLLITLAAFVFGNWLAEARQ